MHTAYKKDSFSLTKQLSEKEDNLQQLTATKKETTKLEKELTHKIAIAETHQQSVELSKKEFQQRQPKKERSISAKFITWAFNLLFLLLLM